MSLDRLEQSEDQTPATELDEAVRLEALSRYTEWEGSRSDLEDIVRLTALVCRAPFADIAIVGADKIWLQAQVGWASKSQIERRHSFAQYVIEREDLVVITDALADAEFRHSPYVTGTPHIRFAAGVPILVQGQAIGTLCVFDRVVRDLSDEAALALRALARQCVSQLELHRSLRIERESEERLQLIFESATDYAIITLDEAGRIRSWNKGAAYIFGWTEGEAVGQSVSILFTATDAHAEVPAADLRSAADHGREIHERYYQRKDRSEFWGTGETMPLVTTSGGPRGYLKILRDRTTQKRIKEALEYQAGVLQAITDHLAEALFQIDVDHRITFLNPAAEAMFGWSRYELLGVNLHDRMHYHRPDSIGFHRDDCPYVIALKSRASFSHRPDVFVHRDGRFIDVVVSFTPIVADGVITGAVMTLVDVTETKQIEEDLRRTQERYQLAVTASDSVGSWDWDLRTKIVIADATFAEQHGVDAALAQRGAPLAAFQAAIHPDDRGAVFDAIDESIARKQQYVGEYRLLRPDGSIRWVSAHARCHYDREGRPVRFPGLSVDITERKRNDERRAALLDLEDRLRNEESSTAITGLAAETLCRLLGANRAGFCSIDATGEYGTIEGDYAANGLASLVGTYRVSDFGSYGDEIRRGILIAIPDVTLDHRMAAEGERWQSIGIASLVNVPLMAEGRLSAVIFVHDDRPHLWSDDDIALIRNVADRTWAALARAQAAARQAILTGELHHRIKNTMAMVLAIANQTMRKATTKEEAFAAFEERILALSGAQDILTRLSWSSAPISEIVAGALAPHRPKDGDRITSDGPDISLSAQTAMSFALALHELATNATKYGALSNETGYVDIVWSVEDQDGKPQFRFVWKEHDGPPVGQPTHKGFGSRLIKGSFVRAIKIAIDYEPDGVRCTFDAPLQAI